MIYLLQNIIEKKSFEIHKLTAGFTHTNQMIHFNNDSRSVINCLRYKTM